MKKILGLDLGTNSIGWSLIERNFDKNIQDGSLGTGKIVGIGSRIIPMTQDVLDKFGKGQSHSQTAERTNYRSVRRLHQRQLLRRERLHRVLNIMEALPNHYAENIDFINKKGQFKENVEVKINYKVNDSKEFEFIFKDSFNEMVSEFRSVHPKLFYTKSNGNETKIPYDWTLYYLRNKALSEKISLEELSWILLNFNQKRGYYQTRGEDTEETKDKIVEFHSLKVIDVKEESPNSKSDIWYNVNLENGWIYRRPSKNSLNEWIGKVKDFIVTTNLDTEGNPKKDKEGNIKRSFRAPNEDDWKLVKLKTQNEIELFNERNNTLGIASYIYNALLNNPKQKINGKLVRTIERDFYKDELIGILECQKKFHDQFNSKDLLRKCVKELYSNNYARQNILMQKDITHFLVNDIIFYQRPLKSKKSLIDNCVFEYRTYKNSDGVIVKKPIKGIHKSHPLYQEFRLWQFIFNLKIFKREKLFNHKLESDVDVTKEFIPDEESKVKLFDLFNAKSKINQKVFLSIFEDVSGKKLSEDKYRWNYVEDKEYPLNETRVHLINRFKKVVEGNNQIKKIEEIEPALWHIIYSIKDKKQFVQALKTFANKNNIDEVSFVKEFKNFKPYDNNYSSYSEKAIKKILPLLRMGKYWDYNKIDDNTKQRIEKIINGEVDESIDKMVREKSINLSNERDYRGLPLWLVSYIVYDRHSESNEIIKWETPNQIVEFLNNFKQHSLRNPIVEQVITETLRVVNDIWEYYGNSKKGFFDEIHVELGREMKNPADIRKKITDTVTKNQLTNERIRNLLIEFKSDNMEGVMPHSPRQQEKLKIFEEDILSQYSDNELKNEVFDGVNISKIINNSEPTQKEIQKYKLWMEQQYRSPYTGSVIPLSKLFTTDYEIEHIIPQAKYFDDSYGNKVICETEVNKVKANQTAFGFISKNPGLKVELGHGNTATLFNLKEYQEFVSKRFKKNSKKFKLLISEDVPEQFISRQLNDTRYISKVVKKLLSNIVRMDNEQEETSKNLISVSGNVTSTLRKDWGIEDKWNEIILPRFERLNELTNSTDFTFFNSKNIKIPTVPNNLKKGFNKKRIDHRHHAMDALTVAIATRNHISYLSNEHAKSDNKRYDLRNKLRRVEKIKSNGKTISVSKEFYLPWKSFPVDAKNALENITVSFKQNLRVINKATNRYNVRKNDKIEVKTQNGLNWSIRKPMHKETVFGKVKLRFKKTIDISNAIEGGFVFVDKELNKELKELRKKNAENKTIKKYFKDKNISKIEVYYFDDNYSAVRKLVDESFKSEKWIRESVTDTGIQKILINHLKKYNEADKNGKIIQRPDLAFSSSGVEEMNKKIIDLNDGKFHQPILKVRVYETLGNKFNVGNMGNNKHKYVEAAKGTNLYFAIYEGLNTQGEKIKLYDTIPLNVAIERQKQGLNPVYDTYQENKKDKLLFYISPNDLVYVPTNEEMENNEKIDFSRLNPLQKKRIYKMVSSTGKECHFIHSSIAKLVKNYDSKSKFGELGSLNKLETTMDINNCIRIKEKCIKIKVDRLGNIENGFSSIN